MSGSWLLRDLSVAFSAVLVMGCSPEVRLLQSCPAPGKSGIVALHKDHSSGGAMTVGTQTIDLYSDSGEATRVLKGKRIYWSSLEWVGSDLLKITIARSAQVTGKASTAELESREITIQVVRDKNGEAVSGPPPKYQCISD